MTPTMVIGSPLYKPKRPLDINKLKIGNHRGSNMSSAVDSQFMESDDYNYEEHKFAADEINS